MTDSIPANRQTAKPTVLVVDNDQTTRTLLVHLLNYWGYRPIVAEGYGIGLENDAVQKARQFFCQLAVVDIRLKDDRDVNDISGLTLIPRLRPTTSIVVSGWLDKNIIRKIVRDLGGISFVGKDEMPDGLKTELAYVAERVCARVRGVQIGPPNIIAEIKKDFASVIPDLADNEIEDILGQLFPEASEITIEKLEGARQSSTLSAVPRPKSTILEVAETVRGERRQPVVVKLARAKKMEMETDRYRKYVENRLVGFYNPTLERSEMLWNLGGAKYSHLGTKTHKIEMFSTYFAHAPAVDIQRCLRQFFGETWSDLYSQTRRVRPVSLFEAYCLVWDRDWFDIRIKGFKPRLPAAAMGEEMARKLQVCEPVSWLIEHVQPGHDASIMQHVGFTTTHGDLHGDNMLIDEHNNAWVIDFERSGPGPLLQDFVELESDILNRLTGASNDFTSFYRLCIRVAGPEHRVSTAETEELSDPLAQKALQAVATLRELSGKYIAPRSDAREYLWGLLFNTLFRASIIQASNAQTPNNKSQERALMLASIICHRIEHWGEPWPPANWPA